jgi:hypothetical protein
MCQALTTWGFTWGIAEAVKGSVLFCASEKTSHDKRRLLSLAFPEEKTSLP